MNDQEPTNHLVDKGEVANAFKFLGLGYESYLADDEIVFLSPERHNYGADKDAIDWLVQKKLVEEFDAQSDIFPKAKVAYRLTEQGRQVYLESQEFSIQELEDFLSNL